MKPIDELLATLNRLDVKLWIEGDRLRCSAPKGVLTPALSAQLQERKAEIVTLLQQHAASNTDLAPIRPAPRTERLPLSFSQQRLWFFEQLHPGSATYIIPFAVRLTGTLNPAALTWALNQIVQRHEVLRTTFPTVDGEPGQRIAPSLSISLPLVDLQSLSGQEQEKQVAHLAALEARSGFRLTDAPLLRGRLLRLQQTEHVLLFTIHHIVFDGWSIGVFLSELSVFYAAALTGESPKLPELPIQYADIAVWQHQQHEANAFAPQLTYWQKQLEGALPLLPLPTDHPRPAQPTFRGATYSFELPSELSHALKTWSQQQQVTLFMTLLTGFKILLYRYTGQPDILVGSPIANRSRTELEPMIGFFVNTLVLRTDLSTNPTVRSLLQQVQQVTLDAYAHQDVPLEWLLETLSTERSLSYNPLFQVMFVLQNAPIEAVQLPGLTLSALPPDSSTAKFDLTLSVTEIEAGLYADLEYSTDLFEASTIARLAGHWQTVLEAMIRHPEQHLSDLPLLTPPEQQQVLVAWNQTQMDYPKQCWHHQFEAQVQNTPEAIALIFEDNHLTYQALNQRANQLAHFLRSRGVGPAVTVGLCVERSPDMIVGILGILKAGGAYVPLDPAYPAERLAYMITDSQVPILLTQDSLMAQLSDHAAEAIALDADWQAIAPFPTTNPEESVTPDHLAYVIYTSGSTGKPKGVLVPHDGLSNLTQAKIAACAIQPQSRVLQFFSLSFDASIPEWVMALGAGATLCLASVDRLRPGPDLLQLLRDQAITHVTMTPSALTALPTADLAALEMVLVGGEACPIDLIRQWSQDRLFINAYGPTEVTVNASMVACGNGHPLLPTVRPSANKQIYLLDEQLQPVPVGVPGELYIGGVGLAWGYLNRADTTAAVFLPDPFSPCPGSRLYRTGDRGRYRQDGAIEFLGRTDAQVKIRGFRIEPGEIESLLNQHPSVTVSVVSVREMEDGDRQLVAYVVFEDASTLTVNDLRRYLQRHVPDYLIPAFFVSLAALPLTPNGKVDRKALPAPDTARPDLDAVFVPPQTDLEHQLADIWRDLLKIDTIGRDDNFFELGGHSLRLVQLLTQLQERFGIELSLRSLFEDLTIARLAERITTLRQGNSPEEESTSLTDLKRLAVLDPDIRPDPTARPPVDDPRRILLTGATGFLGAFLLVELLQHTQAEIYCLVRSPNLEAANQKLWQTLTAYQIEVDHWRSRIIPVLGDLTQPQLGWSDAQFRELASRIDWIYHNGAYVNHVAPYAALAPANVDGTREILRLACQMVIKPVHFISTLSVLSKSRFNDNIIQEVACLLEQPAPLDGYTQSKWVAERLVTIARERGLPISIYRPGRISGQSQTGVFNENDFLYRLICGCLQLGCVPTGEIMLNFVPVDVVSRAIVQLSQQPTTWNQAFHLVHPQPVSSQRLVEQLQHHGYSVRPVPYDEWRATLRQQVERSPDHPLYPLLPLFPALDTQTSNTSAPPEYSCQNTWRELAHLSTTCPPIDNELLTVYIRYLANHGYLPQPQVSPV